MAVLGYLRSLEQGFAAHFVHGFSIKNVLYLMLHLWTRFQCHIFFLSQDIKQNVLYLDN